MRTIILGGLGSAIYAAGPPVQELQMRDNARTEAGGAPSRILMADGASFVLMVNATDKILLA
jgi:hypothetical protein